MKPETPSKKQRVDNYQAYLKNELKLQPYQWVGIILLVVVVSGFVGWVWEFCIQEISNGFGHLYIKGGNLLPWINIYAYGALLIMVTTYHVKKYPWAVFLIAAIACGLLEWFAGWLVYTVGDHTRYWNYEEPWWGIGNIDGFVCPASVCAFGLGALALIYWLLPLCIKLSQKYSRKVFLGVAITLFSLVIIDDIVNLTLKNLNLPTAMNFYEDCGWVYQNKQNDSSGQTRPNANHGVNF